MLNCSRYGLISVVWRVVSLCVCSVYTTCAYMLWLHWLSAIEKMHRKTTQVDINKWMDSGFDGVPWFALRLFWRGMLLISGSGQPFLFVRYLVVFSITITKTPVQVAHYAKAEHPHQRAFHSPEYKHWTQVYYTLHAGYIHNHMALCIHLSIWLYILFMNCNWNLVKKKLEARKVFAWSFPYIFSIY